LPNPVQKGSAPGGKLETSEQPVGPDVVPSEN